MRYSLKMALAVCAGLMTTALAAQVQPVPEQQLANGFLGDRNARMTEHDPAPNETYADQATRAIDRKEYKRALDILKPYRLSMDPAYFYLAGRAQAGLGDYPAARKNLTTAIKKNKKFIGAYLALGLLEAEHGDRAEATRILEELQERQTACAGLCRDSAVLGVAIDSIGAALKARPN